MITPQNTKSARFQPRFLNSGLDLRIPSYCREPNFLAPAFVRTYRPRAELQIAVWSSWSLIRTSWLDGQLWMQGRCLGSETDHRGP